MKNQYFMLLLFTVLVAGCKKSSDTPFTCGSTITDADGNTYHTVSIGNQCWTVENLSTSKYNDGSSIPNVATPSSWNALTTGAWCAYNNDNSNIATYGRMYNWFAVGTGKLAPMGWHVPDSTEMRTLVNNLGGAAVAGGHMKSTGTTLWTAPNTGADNSSGFTALPGGDGYGTFYDLHDYATFWTSTATSDTTADFNALYYSGASVVFSTEPPYKQSAYSVRCLKD